MPTINEDFTHQQELENPALGKSEITKGNEKYNIEVTQEPDGTKIFTFMNTDLGDYLDSILVDPAKLGPVISFVGELMNDDDDFFKALEYADLKDKIKFLTSTKGPITITRAQVEDYKNKVINPESQEVKDELKLNAFRNNRPSTEYHEAMNSIFNCLKENSEPSTPNYVLNWKLSKIKPLQNESIVDFTKRMSKLFCE